MERADYALVSMTRRGTYRVKEVAQLTGISVRALHHYDEIGLLVPKQRTGAGYRLYDDDLLRLQQILIGRELGLALEGIRKSLDDPSFGHRKALLAQKQLLQDRARRTEVILRALDAALDALGGKGAQVTDTKQFFNGFEPSKYQAEAEPRWATTDSYRESHRRTKGYTAEDWQRLAAEQTGIYSDFAGALTAGKPPSDRVVTALAERHRLLIERWFYPCSPARHSALADMYESDSRFAQNIDKYGSGLTPFLVAAIRENGAALGGAIREDATET